MESPSTTEHNHFYPDGLIPVTPQARQYGYTMDVYVTKGVWANYCVWPGGRDNSTEARLVALLHSCFIGIGKALSTSPDMVGFKFKHWFIDAKRPRAKKKALARLRGRLLLHPDTDVAWLLIFNPNFDTAAQLKQGEPPSADSSNNGATAD